MYKPSAAGPSIFTLNRMISLVIISLSAIILVACSAKRNRPDSFYSLKQRVQRELTTYKRSPLPPSALVINGYLYKTNSTQKLRLPIISRTNNQSKDEVVLDLNNLTTEYPFIEIGSLRVNPNNSDLIFSLKLNPSDEYDLFQKSFNEDKINLIAKSVFEFEYGDDGKIYIITLDSKKRPSTLYMFEGDHIEPIYKELDQRFDLKLTRSKDGTLFIRKSSLVEETVGLLREKMVIPVTKGRPPTILTSGVIDGENVLLKAESVGTASKIYVSSPIEDFRWREKPFSYSGFVEGIEVFSDFIVFTVRDGTAPALVFTDHSFKELTRFKWKRPYYALTKRNNEQVTSKDYLFEVSSLIDPPILFGYNHTKKKVKEIAKSTVPFFDSSDYITKQIVAKTSDGSRLPITYYSTSNSASRPTILTGYGSYGIAPYSAFDEKWIPILKRNFVLAICHVRGGSEYGPAWRRKGLRGGKLASVTDFLTCAKTLIDNGIAHPQKLAAMGRSAGATLIASAMNRDPSLFSAVIIEHPFLKVTDTLRNDKHPLTIRDREEWGDPRDLEILNYMKQYDPSLTIGSNSYPPLFVISGSSDQITPLKHTLKWIENFKMHNPNGEVTHRILDNIGHSGLNDSAFRRELESEKAAFIIKHLLEED